MRTIRLLNGEDLLMVGSNITQTGVSTIFQQGTGINYFKDSTLLTNRNLTFSVGTGIIDQSAGGGGYNLLKETEFVSGNNLTLTGASALNMEDASVIDQAGTGLNYFKSIEIISNSNLTLSATSNLVTPNIIVSGTLVSTANVTSNGTLILNQMGHSYKYFRLAPTVNFLANLQIQNNTTHGAQTVIAIRPRGTDIDIFSNITPPNGTRILLNNSSNISVNSASHCLITCITDVDATTNVYASIATFA
jgi:hypothetical protein